MDEQRRQEYLRLIDQFLNRSGNRDIDRILSAHADLIDQGLLVVVAEVIEVLHAQGKEVKAEGLKNLLDDELTERVEATLVQEPSVSSATGASAQFLVEILQCIFENQGAEEPVYALLRANQERLNAELLAALPRVAAILLTQTEDDIRQVGAAVLFEFGDLLRQFLPGQQAINIELAIAAYEQVLQVRTRKAMPLEWVKVQTYLAIAYRSRIQGDRAENLEQAIATYEQVLQVATRQAMPLEWAIVQMNLANAYTERIRGDRAENLEQAIAAYEPVLQVVTRKAMPLEWATAQMNLAVAYAERIRGDRAENLEQAIAAYEQALQVRTRKAMPLEWAKAQMNLANAYAERIRGDRAENLEQAIAAYKQVLQVMTRKVMPLEWARTQMNLAIAYRNRIRDNKAQNIEDAIAAYQQALTVMTQAAMPIKWAEVTMNLANAYLTRIRGDKAQNIEDAITACKQALTVMTQAAMPIKWAEVTMNLANAYFTRIQGDKAQNIEDAIAAYQQALTVMTQAATPVDWAANMNNLAIAYCAADRWADAHATYAEAIDGIEALRSQVMAGDDIKQKLAEEWNGLYQGMVTTCLQLGNPAEALEYAEGSKARNLIDLLANRVEPQNLPPATLAEFHRLKKVIKTEELRLQSEELTRLRPVAPDQAETYTTRPIPDRTQLNTLIQQLEHLIKIDIQRHDTKFVATQTVEPLTYLQIQALLPNPQTALIEWYIQDDRVLAFVVTQHSLTPTVIAIDKSGLDQLIAWTNRYLENYDNASANWQTNLGVELGDLAEILQTNDVLASEALTGCNSLILIPHLYLHLLPLHALPLATHSSLLDRFPGGIRYAPCCQLLHLTQHPTQTDITHLFAIQNPTNDLPFTDVEVAAIRPLFDPQVQVLAKHEAHKAAVTTQTLQPGHALHFACHGYFNWQDPLKSGLVLAGADSALTSPSKNRERYIRQVNSKDLETTCLTLGNLFSRDIDLTHCRLVTLSACETGQVDPRSTSDEYIGLPSGFLFAGSPSIVSSLWRVSDISTSFLMVQFYQRLKAGQSVPIALNQAQIWLRQVTKAELEAWAVQLSLSPARRLHLKALLHQKDNDFRPFESPYHWAAFCAVGS